MPVRFRILPQVNLVQVTYAGLIDVEETRQAMLAYLAHPDFRLGQLQLVDFTEVTGLTADIPHFLAFMAEVAGMMPLERTDHMLVYLAPTAIGREIALRVARSWDGIPGVTLRITASPDEARAVLGLQHFPAGT